jgi:hypothetical protein
MLTWTIPPLGAERLRFLRLHDTASGVWGELRVVPDQSSECQALRARANLPRT